MKFTLKNFVSGIITDDIATTRVTFSEPTIVYFLEGNYTVTVDGKKSQFTSNHFLLLNVGEVANIEAHDSISMVLQLSFRLSEINDIFEVDQFYFETKSNRVLHDEELSAIIISLLKAVLSQDRQLQMVAIGKSYELLNLLVLEFAEVKPVSNDQVLRIKRYIEAHYAETLNLKKISGIYYMEPSYFSRYFKKNIGVNFKDYLTNIRLNHAELELQRPDLSIAQIALECGFSSLSSFNRSFKQKFNLTPSQYRDSHAHLKVQSIEKKPIDTAMIQRANVLLATYSKRLDARSSVELHISEQKMATKMAPKIAMILNFGEIQNLERVDWKEHLRKLIQTTTFKYARLQFTIESLETIDDFTLNLLKQVIDECMVKGVIPWLTFSLNEDSISQRTLDGMTLMCRFIADHLAVNVVSQWPFEVQSSSGRITEKLVLTYKKVKATLRKTLPGVQVGGLGENVVLVPEGAGRYEHLVDFITLRTCIPVSSRLGTFNSILRAGRQQLIDFFEDNQWPADKSIFLTELGIDTKQTNYLQDSLFVGAYFMQQVMAVIRWISGCGSILGSDSFGARSQLANTLSAGKGMITANGLTKPSLQAVKFINEFSGTSRFVQLDQNYYAGFIDTDVYVLGNNIRYPLLTDNFDLSNPRLVNERLPEGTVNVSVVLDDIASGSYEIRMFQCRGDILSKWEKFDFYQELRNSDIGLMAQTSDVDVSLNIMSAKNHRLALKYTVGPNNYFIIHVRKKNEILDS
ncbi:helix-turn-helix transcriptional regulator [Lacticaseibacillus sp. GG6-2]